MLMHAHLSFLTYAFLALSAVIAGLVDTIAGGGGLITVPAMLSVGALPVNALGTTRFCSAIGELTAIARFKKSGILSFQTIALGIITTIVGAAIGTLVLQHIHPQRMQRLIPYLLLIILCYISFSPHFGAEERPALMPSWCFNLLFGLLIGSYNGVFGPGTGSFWVIAFSGLMGMSLQQSVMHAKPMNLAGNLSSLTVFIIAGHVAYFIGIIMSAGQFVGANIGASIVMSKWTRLIKPLFIVIVLLMTCRLFWQYYH